MERQANLLKKARVSMPAYFREAIDADPIDIPMHYMNKNFHLIRHLWHLTEEEPAAGPMRLRDVIEAEADEAFRNYTFALYHKKRSSMRFD